MACRPDHRYVPQTRNRQEIQGVDAICLHNATPFQPSTPPAML
jgi:hypothetical protein